MNEVCETPEMSDDYEPIAKVVRENSQLCTKAFENVCFIREFLDQTSAERNVNTDMPGSMREEVIWQRSMLDRINEELLDIKKVLGV